jgi:hypothetical protein
MHSRLSLLVLCVSLVLPSVGKGASAKTYQVTGPVVDVTPTVITVQKGDEKWEIARDPSAKDDAPVKVGDRVTIHYRMTVTSIDSKAAAGDEAKTSDDADTPAKKKKKSKE